MESIPGGSHLSPLSKSYSSMGRVQNSYWRMDVFRWPWRSLHLITFPALGLALLGCSSSYAVCYPSSSRRILTDGQPYADKYYPTEKPQWILSTIGTLSRDESKDVRAFVAAISRPLSTTPNPSDVRGLGSASVTTPAQHTFSRPPPPSAATSIDVEMTPMGPKPTSNWDGRNYADVAPSPKSSLSALKNGYDHETKGATPKTKDGVGRSALSPRTKNGRVSR